MDNQIDFKYNEDTNVATVLEYISKTYSEHYANDQGVQTIDVWQSMGIAEQMCQGTAIKYLMRWGKKDGRNEKDLLKAIHYIILLIHFSQSEQQSQ